jgi:transcriptional regulator with XRE-family HTH domain
MTITQGRAIQSAREARGLPRAILATLVGCDRTTILNIETGRNDPRFSLLCAVAGQLGIDLNELAAMKGDA